MDSICRRIVLFFCLMSVASVPALAANWTQPTPDELKMTSDPAAPDSPAVYLFNEEIVNDKMHSHVTYARIKILTEKGKEKFSEIEIPYEKGQSGETISNVEGRTIEPDGTIVPFTGKPFNKELVKSGDVNGDGQSLLASGYQGRQHHRVSLPANVRRQLFHAADVDSAEVDFCASRALPFCSNRYQQHHHDHRLSRS